VKYSLGIPKIGYSTYYTTLVPSDTIESGKKINGQVCGTCIKSVLYYYVLMFMAVLIVKHHKPGKVTDE
jgi:hypothetical protein